MKLIYTYLILFPLFCFSQKQGNIWYFGDHAGLDFNSGTPIAITNGATYNESSQNHSEGTSAICDSSGSILFYTNGQFVWNKNHQVMSNGDSLLGHLSSTQAALIVPQPGNSRFFYVFTTDAFYQDYLQYGFRYSIVDICLDNGLGDVIPNQKNILLLNTVAEKLTAVRHTNGIDYWVITHKYNSNAFYAYLLTNTGISSPVITYVGSVQKDYCTGSTEPTKAALGQLKASPDGSKLICVSGQGCNNISELFDFDKTTGIISNTIQLATDNIAVGLYGASFSPDNSKLYISCWIGNPTEKVYQYDLSSGNPTTIISSKTIVASHSGGPWFMGMQLGPNGKIYIAVRNQSSIAVINNPNLAGTSCNLVDGAISLNGKFCSLGLPNFVDFYNYSNTVFNCSTGIEEEYYNKQISISPNPFSYCTTLHTNDYFRDATLTVYNSFGQHVKQIKNISEQTVTLFRDNLSSGLYFIRLTQDDKVITVKKLVVSD